MRPAFTCVMLAFLVGCATPPPAPPAPVAAPQGEPTGDRRVTFLCDGGEEIEMRFFPLAGVGVLVRNGKTMELQQQPAASGFLYSNGPSTVRGKGDELSVEIDRMASLNCTAKEKQNAD